MEILIGLFENANSKFLKQETDLILSGVAERTLCGSLMSFLQGVIKKTKYSRYYIDVEYNRNDGKIKTIINNNLEVITINCDIIIHSRGEIVSQDNLIAIEMKKSTSKKSEKKKDKERLIALTKDNFDDVWSFDDTTFPEHVCRYGLGIYYEINSHGRQIHIEYYIKGRLFDTKKLSF